jgi:cell wall assembly regulator SMI1
MCDLVSDLEGWISEPVGPIKKVWANPQWIPMTNGGGAAITCVDLDPAEGGVVGQVIDYHHETGPIRVQATSFRAFLARHADDLEAGKCRYNETSGNIARVKE